MVSENFPAIYSFLGIFLRLYCSKNEWVNQERGRHKVQETTAVTQEDINGASQDDGHAPGPESIGPGLELV